METIEQDRIPFIESKGPDIEHGAFAPSTTDAAPNRLILATFNIRYAVGSFLISGSLLRRIGVRMPSRRPQLVSRHIRRAALALSDGILMPRVDFLGLQEADKHTARAGGIHVAQELARELQMHYARASLNIARGEEQIPKQWYLDFEEHIAADDMGDTGLAMLSRFPFISTFGLELPWNECAWRPRLAMKSVIQVGQTSLRIYNAHIDPHASTDDQLEQHRVIIRDAEKEVGPTVLLGDFNTLTSESRVRMRGLLETHGYKTPFRNGVTTWRAGLIRLQPDWIFVRDAKVLRCGVARGLGVSDHWPVWVELEIPESG